MRWVLRSKIHKATVTEADVNYVGSVTIDQDLMDRVGLWPGERVLIVDNTNGARIETYTIAGPRGSGAVEINGAAAHQVNRGDEVIIMGFELSSVHLEPKAILVDARNRFVRDLVEEPSTVLPA
jgi:aspartate 1-decarboxylase